MTDTAGSRQLVEGSMDQWWARPAEEVLGTLQVSPDVGLSTEEVRQSREKYGSNRLEDRGPASLWSLLWDSVKSPMMVLLLSIAGISLVLGQLREAAVMVFVVAMYVGVHLLNKARSDRTMARLRDVQAPTTTVLREGARHEVGFEEVVVGDVLPLRSGSRIPADARLVSSAGLIVDESTLTGESAPVHKDAKAEVDPDTPLAERESALFAGTTALDGQGKAVVTAVGEGSELGRIAKLATLRDAEPTPLQREMSDLARTLAFVALGISLLIPLVGFLRGFELREMVLTWLALTFLMVPGQPPIIIAMALALAALELARRGVIVRRLQGAETLGSVNRVLSDKTGTMTENEMQLSEVLLPTGEPVKVGEEASERPTALERFLEAALPAIPENTNDPTDLALTQAAKLLGDRIRPEPGELVNLVGFSRGGTYRSLEYVDGGGKSLYLTGRPEFVLGRSTRRMAISGEKVTAEDWGADDREALSRKLAELASEGKRITAYAYRRDGASEPEPKELIFAGAAVISDPIRPEVKDAVRRLEGAGVRTVMVTGDVPETASYVAREVGLDASKVVTGRELDGLTEEELTGLAQETSVFARTTPEHKLKLVRAYRNQGQIVAVTGDGVNDAPALNAAHIGIAMGEKGTDVARESADLILTDDNFARLPDGVEIGRKAYDNFRKGITYYLSAKAILLMSFVVPLLARLPFPLAPIQIIFTELLMDLASSTIFVTESAEPGVMRRKPRPRGSFLSWEIGRTILRNMVGLTLAILVVYFGSLALEYGVDSARTAAFATWLLGHIVLALNLKQETLPLFKQGLLSNRFAAGWLVGMIGFVLAMTLLPFAQSVLQTTGLSGLQWGMVIGGALLASMWMEGLKWLRWRASGKLS